ncbi:hypothetical protein [Bartonella acomydis]|uniref:hypothetical protein n=1 Tax=Bartonella acomydis TaxID=686234 RepID=UPI0031F179E5
MNDKLQSFFQYSFAVYGMIIKILLLRAEFDNSGGAEVFALCLPVCCKGVNKSYPIKVVI